ncbi:MAG: hypothetical protein AB2689_06215 [Candidatus Thiodiazotropha taylori]
MDIGPYTLLNRIVMAPLTRCRVGRGGVPGSINALYYAQRTTAGLIISEVYAVDLTTPSTPTCRSAGGFQHNEPDLNTFYMGEDKVHIDYPPLVE